MHCGEVCHTGALEGRGGKKQEGLWPASSPVRGRLRQPRNWMRMMHVEELCVHGVRSTLKRAAGWLGLQTEAVRKGRPGLHNSLCC